MVRDLGGIFRLAGTERNQPVTVERWATEEVLDRLHEYLVAHADLQQSVPARKAGARGGDHTLHSWASSNHLIYDALIPYGSLLAGLTRDSRRQDKGEWAVADDDRPRSWGGLFPGRIPWGDVEVEG